MCFWGSLGSQGCQEAQESVPGWFCDETKTLKKMIFLKKTIFFHDFNSMVFWAPFKETPHIVISNLFFLGPKKNRFETLVWGLSGWPDRPQWPHHWTQHFCSTIVCIKNYVKRCSHRWEPSFLSRRHPQSVQFLLKSSTRIRRNSDFLGKQYEESL